MNHHDIPPEVVKALPGTVGSVVALRWIAGSPLQRIASVVGGIAASYYAGEHISSWMDVSPGLAGFLVGLFAMAVAAKCFETISALNPLSVAERILKRWGL